MSSSLSLLEDALDDVHQSRVDGENNAGTRRLQQLGDVPGKALVIANAGDQGHLAAQIERNPYAAHPEEGIDERQRERGDLPKPRSAIWQKCEGDGQDESACDVKKPTDCNPWAF